MTTVQQEGPTQSLEFVCEWFERARKNAAAAGKKDAAVLWGDGLDQIRSMATQRDDLVAALAETRAWIHNNNRKIENQLRDAGLGDKIEAALAKAGV